MQATSWTALRGRPIEPELAGVDTHECTNPIGRPQAPGVTFSGLVDELFR